MARKDDEVKLTHKLPPKEEHYETGHTSKDNSKRHYTDQVIRSHGYQIHSRKGDQEPTWSKDGKVYTQNEVMWFIQREGSK